jgi:hypothetical protein
VFLGRAHRLLTHRYKIGIRIQKRELISNIREKLKLGAVLRIREVYPESRFLFILDSESLIQQQQQKKEMERFLVILPFL